MASSQLMNNNSSFGSNKLANNFDVFSGSVQTNSATQSSPSMKAAIEPAPDGQAETAVCGICLKESLKDDLITCSECGLGGKCANFAFDSVVARLPCAEDLQPSASNSILKVPGSYF